MTKAIPAPDAKFWARVDKDGDCWVWTGGADAQGYGRWRGTSAHRITLNSRLAPPVMRRKLDPGERSHWQALHRCDNPPCVNPEHLYWGTAGHNADDRTARHPKCEYVSIMWGRRCGGNAAYDLGDVWACGPHYRWVIKLGRTDIPTIYDVGLVKRAEKKREAGQ